MSSLSRTKDSSEALGHTDGGYGWVVVAAAFFIGFFTDGLYFSFGVLLVDLLDVFKKSRTETVMIASLGFAVRHLIAPFVGILSEKYGHRKTVIIGTLISCTGYMLSIFTTELYQLNITFGFVTGVGFGLMYMPATVCVMQFFNERRTLANGINVCGSGVGTFAFSHLTRHLLDTYGWRGTLLVESGLLLHGVICGLLLPPPRKTNLVNSSNRTDCKDLNKCNENEDDFDCSKNELQMKEQDDKKGNKENVDSFDEGHFMTSEKSTQNYSSTFIKRESKSPCQIWLAKIKIVLLQMFDVTLFSNRRFLIFLVSTIILSFSYIVPFNFLPDQAEELGMEKRESAWISASVGLTNTIGRVAVGWFGNKAFVNRFLLYASLIFLTGITTAVSPLLITFHTKLLYACTFGFLIGGCVTLFPVVLTDLFGVRIFSRAFGILYFFLGISGLLSGPLGGWFYDVSGGYNITFVVAGFESIFAAVIMLLSKQLCPNRKLTSRG